MHRFRCFVGLLTVFFLFTATAQAAVVVNTGNTPCPTWEGCYGIGLYNQGSSDFQSVANKFSVSSATNITDIQGWMQASYQFGNTLTISIYGDSGQTPTAGQRLFSQSFTVVDSGLSDGAGNQWQGASGLNFYLAPGAYWVAFEVLPGQTYQYGDMPIGIWAPPAPLSDGALLFPTSATYPSWQASDTSLFGVKINGDVVSAVPVPATLLLFLSGFVGLGGTAIKLGKKRSIA